MGGSRSEAREERSASTSVHVPCVFDCATIEGDEIFGLEIGDGSRCCCVN